MKRSRTLSYRLSIIFILSMVLTMGAGAFATYMVQERIVQNFTNSRLKNSVYEFSKVADDAFMRASITVENRKYLVEYLFKSKEDLADSTKVNDGIAEISTLFDLSSQSYYNVCGYYVVLNPSLTSQTAEDPTGKGFFHIKNGDTFVDFDVTNILKYDASDFGHVGWWYSALNKTSGVWTEPYFNKNINKNVISYVSPLYAENKQDFLGVLGIDLDLNLVIDDLQNTNDYTDAYSILLNKDGRVIYHKDVPTFVDGKYVGSDKTLEEIAGIKNFHTTEDDAITYEYNGKRRTAMSISLTNDLIYSVSVKTSELRKPLRLVTIIPLIVYLSLAILIGFVIYFIIRKHIRPIQDLHEAVDKAKKGDYKYNIKPKNDDEIGDLTKAFTQMIDSIAEKNKIISAMAYIDGLTGVKNSNAYKDTEKRLDQAIKDGTACFAVVMLDVDKLKFINDNLGHGYGDKAIVGSCYTLCKAFSHSPVFRVGGDEFVAIVENEDYENRQEIFEKLKNHQILVRNTKYDFSVGMATFDKGVDHSFKDVFARADSEMYLDKKGKK